MLPCFVVGSQWLGEASERPTSVVNMFPLSIMFGNVKDIIVDVTITSCHRVT